MVRAALALLLVASGCKNRHNPSTVDAGPPALVKGPWAFGKALPGTEGFPTALVTALERAWTSQGSGAKPLYTNRLFLETSPYLQQHAHNPVNWFPWGDEAFAEARRLNRPVLLSIGYSTCHWCHVMEEESFENDAIARTLNEHYIVIKVDREEHPEVDNLYMTAVRTLSGSGGWPLTVWLTPDRRPFFGGTYYPPAEFSRMLTLLEKKYVEDPDGVASQAQTLTQMVERALATSQPADSLDPEVFHAAARFFLGNFDESDGGIRRQPKFPSDFPVRALFRYHRRTGDPKTLSAALLTLEKMARGGIYDHVGGGFHRYSTDERWRIPHFEKMLYDNALLAMAYTEGYVLSRRPDFARVVRETLDWADREMSDENGGFYSATDADSLGPDGKRREGRYFTWTLEELDAVLGAQTRAFSEAYGVTAAGNLDGRNVLYLERPEPAGFEVVRATLRAGRDRRTRPLRDEKILTGWNGLMISAFAQAALAMDNPAYAARATRAAEFLWARARDSRGRLFRTVTGGTGRLNASLEDYAYLCAAFLDLFEATGDLVWLERAVELDRAVEEHFEDREHGGFYRTSDDHDALIIRDKPSEDGPMPSGTSVHTLTLYRLHEYTTRASYRNRGDKALRTHLGRLRREPNALPDLLLALDYALDQPKQIVIVATGSRTDAGRFLKTLGRAFVPNRALVVVAEKDVAALSELIPLVKDKRALKEQTTAFVCVEQTCQLPTGDPKVFATQLLSVEPLTPAGGSAP